MEDAKSLCNFRSVTKNLYQRQYPGILVPMQRIIDNDSCKGFERCSFNSKISKPGCASELSGKFWILFRTSEPVSLEEVWECELCKVSQMIRTLPAWYHTVIRSLGTTDRSFLIFPVKLEKFSFHKNENLFGVP